jgi:predicted nucleotidyltransferase
MAYDAETMNRYVNNYVADVKSVMNIDHVFIFGSNAKGAAGADSDIDLCFFSQDFEDKQRVDILIQLCRMRRNYNRYVDIEPHAFPTSELLNDNPFVKEILRTGREI